MARPRPTARVATRAPNGHSESAESGGDVCATGLGFARGAGAMGAARLALGILGGLFSGRLAKQPAKTIRGVLTLDFLRQTCFAGCFVGTYKAVLAWLGARRRKGQKEGATGGPPTSLDAAIAAAIAGLTIMIDDPGRRRTVSLYLASRATAMLLRIAVARRVLPRIPLFSALVFTLAQVPNMTALVFEPDCLNADYYRLILKWCLAPRACSLVRRVARAARRLAAHHAACVRAGLSQRAPRWPCCWRGSRRPWCAHLCARRASRVRGGGRRAAAAGGVSASPRLRSTPFRCRRRVMRCWTTWTPLR